MENRFNDQVAVITGGGDGLGFALASRLVSEGAKVALFDINTEKLNAAQAKLGQACLPVAVDVTQEKAVAAAVSKVMEWQGRIDILVNSAGIPGKTNTPSHLVELGNFDKVMSLNARAPLVTAQAVLPHMLKAGYGRILHVASIAGKEGNAGMVAYSMSKAAVIGLTKVQGKEYAQQGVTVNAIAPAVIQTELVAAMPQEQVKYMTDKIPMKRCGTLEEFAAMAAFIVSPEASFSSGFTFDLSGARATY